MGAHGPAQRNDLRAERREEIENLRLGNEHHGLGGAAQALGMRIGHHADNDPHTVGKLRTVGSADLDLLAHGILFGEVLPGKRLVDQHYGR